MKRILAALMVLVTLLGVLAMTSCGKKDGIPKGMQLVRGGTEVGYNFYGPEEWIISNYGDISCTYVSISDTSSVTFAETEKPEGTIAEYFESEKAKFPFEINVTVDGEICNFGNAYAPATKYVYTYKCLKYDSRDGEMKEGEYSCMQIFVTYGERFFIFTYTARTDNYTASDESYYDHHLENVQAIIDAFEFTDKTGSPATPEYKRDTDGYILISDKVIAGFDMYVPDSFKVDYSSGIVSASHSDGSTFSMSTSRDIGSGAWDKTKKKLNSYTGNSVEEIQVNVKVELAGTALTYLYEYTYALDGVDYHVYQLHIAKTRSDWYVFTYTSPEECYESHLEEMHKVLDKIGY